MPQGAEAVARVGTLVEIERAEVVQVVAAQRPEFVRVIDRKVAECIRASSVKRRESAGVRRRGTAAYKRVVYDIVIDIECRIQRTGREVAVALQDLLVVARGGVGRDVAPP